MTNAAHSLAEGWRRVRLGEVAEYLNGRAFKPEEWVTSGLPIIRIENLNSPLAPFNYFDGQVDSRNVVNDGDLLISWSASLDAYTWRSGPAVLNQHIFKVEERKDLITREYLYFVARHAMREIRSQVHGATMRHITKPEFEAIQIPLPPLAEQKRITAILNEQMAAVERARAAAEAQLEAAKALPAAYLRAVFSGPDAHRWGQVRLGSISTLVIDGPHVTPTYVPKGVPFLTVRNIVNRRIDLSDVSYVTAEDYAEFSRRGKIERGDILYTKDGTMGVPCVVDSDLDFSFFVSVALIKLVRDRACPWFIAYALESPAVLGQVKQLGAGAGLKHMVLKSIRALELPLPPLSEQQSIVAMLNDQMASAARARTANEEELDAINKLPAALLRRAFNGEL
jgi:type I restriction enzyme S subunit